MAETFSYTARTAAGAFAHGELTANDRDGALAALTQQGLSPILVKKAEAKGVKMNLSPANWPVIGKLLSGGRVKPAEKVFFSRQLAIMADAQVPIGRALALLEKQASSPRMKKVVGQLAQEVGGGATVAESLAKFPDVFSTVYVNMVKAGEAGGILNEVLDRLATQQEKDAEILSKVKGAAIYPAVISTAAIGAFVFLMTVIVPKLAVIFDSFGGTLPLYTRVMLGASHFLIHNGLILAGVVAIIVLSIYQFHRTKQGKKFFDTLALKVPILGPLIIKLNVARFGRTFGSLISSGLAVVEALNITADALGNTLFKEELHKTAEEVKNGRPVSEVLTASKIFPPIVPQMLRVGEETGQVDKVLLKVAGFYEKEVDAVVSNLTSIIEPVLIIMLGIMVGGIVLSVFGPITKVSQTVPK